MNQKIFFTVIVFTLLFSAGISLGETADSLNVDSTKVNYISETFSSTRLINGHSVENLKNRQLEFRISHRFGQLNEGIDQFYGLDHGTIHLSLEYGIKDWIEVGIGRSTFFKTVDGFVKASLIRQSTGIKNFPVHISYLGSMEIETIRFNDTLSRSFANRSAFVHQVLIARKISDDLSVQLSPTFVHRNLVQSGLDRNDLFAIGTGARYKITRWISLTFEYYFLHRPNRDELPTRYYNPLSVGIDIDTGSGHVFQIMLTNSQAMREAGFIGKTTGNWGDGGIHLGFNITRLFSFSKEE